MDLVAAAPADWLAAATPVSGGAAPLLRSTAAEATADGTPTSFEWLLGLLDAPPAGGQDLPAGGNGLPLVPVSMLPLPSPALAPMPAPIPPAASPAPSIAREPAAASTRVEIAAPPSLAVVVADDLPASPAWAHAWRAAGATTPKAAPASTVSSAAATTATAASPVGAPALELPVRPAPTESPTLPLNANTASLATLAQAAPMAAIETALTPARMAGVASAAPRSAPSPAPGYDEAATAPTGTATTSASPALLMTAAPAPAPAIPAAVVHAALRSDDGPAVTLATAADSLDAALSPPAASPPPGAPTVTPSAQALPLPTHVSADHARGAPLDSRAPSWPEAFASRLQWLVDHRVGEARIKLNPPELGAIDVKISLVDDKTYVQLTAASAAARDELSQGLPRLKELFVSSGIELGGASVQGGHADRGRYEGGGGYRATGQAGVADEPPVGRSDTAVIQRFAPAPAGRIDIFA